MNPENFFNVSNSDFYIFDYLRFITIFISKDLRFILFDPNFQFQISASTLNFQLSAIKNHPALGKLKYYTNFAPSKKYIKKS